MATGYFSAAQNTAGLGSECDLLFSLWRRANRKQLAELAGLPLLQVKRLLACSAGPDIGKLDTEISGDCVLFSSNNNGTAVSQVVHSRQTLKLPSQARPKLIAF